MKKVKRSTKKGLLLTIAIASLLASSPFYALADEDKSGDLRAAVQNPIS